ncbi:NAD-specific glutamate dehydrogenase [Marinobacterium nitratireducens]|uniref:NAD-specific glutamate dehydrogenase n=1 Tax=Marinobacterium nitratireducens TaxID=518897 RepID=A0A917Z8A9_9GAMM|nr:NAD-glutamate dehydrogenase [Marinobacterium nitratireducens]GGO75660.1 NAD-specific glutamate dehydrogenase [Marinobacterium nitratireducens]
MSEQRGENKHKILQQLDELYQSRLAPEVAARVEDFSARYYRVSPLQELGERRIDNLYGATLSCWEFLNESEGCTPRVRVFNPDLEQHGWHCNHTVILILHPDMPFLVDSVRMELNRREMAIHVVHSSVLGVVRDEDGNFEELVERKDERGSAEALMYFEVDRHSAADEVKQLRAHLLEVLGEVRASVADFDAMRKRLSQACVELGGAPDSVDPERIAEAREFCDWMLSDRFTFLGFDELRFEGEGDGFQVSRVDASELGTLKLRVQAGATRVFEDLRSEEYDFMVCPEPLMFAKDASRARVHRPAHQDVVVIKRYGDDGRVSGEYRFFGLWTSPVYFEPPGQIPILRQRATRLLQSAGFDRRGHSGKALMQILTDLPRDELFLASDDELFEMVMGIFTLQERRKIKLLIRRDACSKFFTCLYFVPRDLYTTALRLQVQQLLIDHFGALDCEFTTRFSESLLARVHFVLQVDPGRVEGIDPHAIEAEVVDISRAWSEELHEALIESSGEEQGNALANSYRHAFPSAYRENFRPNAAVYDIQRIEQLDGGQALNLSFYRVLEQTREVLRFKLFHPQQPLVLSDVIPVLEKLGMRVVGEHPYKIKRRDGSRFWIHDFTLQYDSEEPVELEDVRQNFQEAFSSIWNGRAESDEFNRLVIGANLTWREVAMLRAYARYNQQIRFGFSQPYIADTLARHLHITRLLVALFRARFEPGRQSSKKIQALTERIAGSIIDGLDKVDNLNDDKILRRFLELIRATLRTNYYQRGDDGELKDYFAFKLDPHAIGDIPLPRPMFEVFVYSARVEGVHLRGGRVARGGLRWSDRREDYRTEVLGLVKAQQVKNAVIVPVGAKGGFVAKQLPAGGSRDEIQAEGIASYRTFIRALLDVTDNLVAGELQPPPDLVRHDGDDPYLVVAADKGTATFSDIANGIAEEFGFWLGDAFASGGSQGYDHKKMGITARGAWESVKLHFRELGLDTQSQDFTVVAIGDMAGDVFGNGMLMSQHIRLVAAFNHLHIFIDPQPDAASSFAERQRLFELPRSSWTDYNAELISEGGGVFARSAKWIPISPQMKQRFDIDEDRLAPNDLISALLKAQVDLIWNGGIGTYVKAANETHADVGDKANDGLRIDGHELRCRVLGEGGNLGFTQLGRIEYGLRGGASNTDFIDNAGGVDCSDREVNIKILLNEVVANGDMTLKQRNNLLRDMTEDVSRLVLKNNYDQALAISIAQRHSCYALDDYIRLIHRLESAGRLVRSLEFIPGDEVLQERKTQRLGLTRPELSVLISYAKSELKEQLTDSWITSDPLMSREAERAFPPQLVERFPEQVQGHRLRAEIVATQVANGMVNRMGITFVQRLQQASGRDQAAIAAAYVIAREVYDIEPIWKQIEALDNQVDARLQQGMMLDLIRLVRRASYWFLLRQRAELQVAATVERYQPGVREIGDSIGDRLQGQPREVWQQRRDELVAAGVSEALASRVASADSLYALLGVIEAAAETGQALERVAAVYFDIGERLDLHWFDQQVRAIEVANHWQSMARDGLREDLNAQMRELTVKVLAEAGETEDGEAPDALVSGWLDRRADMLERWQQMLAELRGANLNDCAIFTVALRELLDLAQASV